MTWMIAGMAWLWIWGFVLMVAAVQKQKGRMRLGGWDWIVCVFWPVVVPLAVVLILWEESRRA